MRDRSTPPAKPPLWHRSRLGWINALGFALTFFLGVWLLLAAFANLMPKADPIHFDLPTPFVAVLALAHVATVLLCTILVVVFMLRGANMSEHRPRMYVFYWTCAGLLFYLVQVVVLLKFGRVSLPNAAGFASEIYWGAAPFGLFAFALMAYVNIELPGDHPHPDEDWHEEEDWDEDEDDDWHEDDQA